MGYATIEHPGPTPNKGFASNIAIPALIVAIRWLYVVSWEILLKPSRRPQYKLTSTRQISTAASMRERIRGDFCFQPARQRTANRPNSPAREYVKKMAARYVAIAAHNRMRTIMRALTDRTAAMGIAMTSP